MVTDVVAGCDFSLIAPAIVVESNSEIFSKCFLRNDLSIIKKLSDFEKQFVEVHIKDNDMMNDIDLLTDEMLNFLTKFNVSVVNIEGFSYGSTGASYIQLIQYQSILRYKLFKNGIKVNIISPKSVKCAAGKGNLTKVEMFESFCNMNFDLRFDCDFQKYCRDNKENIYSYTKRKKTKIIELTGIKKPFEDIIDAFFCLKSAKDGNKGY